jgi:16S rRNA A1518/A1519 N6-dimethyltransferase RsmA/KsgA/DIM1 with predicted DNA glycosylase/AP lyase activity
VHRQKRIANAKLASKVSAAFNAVRRRQVAHIGAGEGAFDLTAALDAVNTQRVCFERASRFSPDHSHSGIA